MSLQEDKKKQWSRNSIPKYIFCCSYVSLEITERAPVELSWIPLVDMKLIFATDNYVVGLVDRNQKEQQSWYSSLTFLAVTQRLKKLREVCISDTWEVSDDGALQCVKLLFILCPSELKNNISIAGFCLRQQAGKGGNNR
jgi:hypothetical protein